MVVAGLCIWVHWIMMTEVGTRHQSSRASHPGEPGWGAKSLCTGRPHVKVTGGLGAPLVRGAEWARCCSAGGGGGQVATAQLVEEVGCSTQGNGRPGTPLANMMRQTMNTASQSSWLVLHGPQFRSTELLCLVCVSRGFTS